MTGDQAGMDTRKWMAQADRAMAATYKRVPVVF